MSALLEVRDLRVEHGEGAQSVVALDGVSFTLDKGQTLGLLGASGSGKSSLCTALLGLLPRGSRIAHGTVSWRGRRIDDLPESELRQLRGAEIGMVFQEPDLALHPTRTVGGQIVEVLRAHGRGTPAERRTRTLDLLVEMGFDAPQEIDRAFPHQLSGGQRQRVVIAQALACDPDLLLADEPTAALDAVVRDQILALLARLRAERGLAMILVSHDADMVEQIADQVLELELELEPELEPEMLA